MEGKRFIERLCVRNLLSFGPEGIDLDLEPLNVLIGPNASGKSNFIEVLNLLRSFPGGFNRGVGHQGGVRELLWKGGAKSEPARIALRSLHPNSDRLIDYEIAFDEHQGALHLAEETIESTDRTGEASSKQLHYRNNGDVPVLRPAAAQAEDGSERFVAQIFNTTPFARPDMDRNESVLGQIRDSKQYPEITFLGAMLSLMNVYKAWSTGTDSPLRIPQKTDLPADFLREDGANLGLVLGDLRHRLDLRQVLRTRLGSFYDGLVDVDTRVSGGRVEIFAEEAGLREKVPANRLSDGTLRFLCLLAILCHPEPPRVVCMEEPELGMHPDILPVIAEMMVEASQRCQLVVATHSDALVSALSEHPECVLVCQRDEGGTRMQRLDAERLKKWLEKYTLGDLWRMGEIGGNR